MGGCFLAAKSAKAEWKKVRPTDVARAVDVARAPSPLQGGASQGRGGLATSAWRKGGAA